MLVVTVHGVSFANTLKSSCDRPINALHVLQCHACSLDVLGGIGCFNSLVTPAHLGMVPQITGGPGITCI